MPYNFKHTASNIQQNYCILALIQQCI